MVQYGLQINPTAYTYVRPIFITEPGVSDRVNTQVYIKLDDSNFNFELLKSDHKDIRFAENLNGSSALCYWHNHYDLARKKFFIWIKIPFIGKGETKQIFMFWGREDDVGAEDMESLDFYFVSDFRNKLIDTTKWSTNQSAFHNIYGLRFNYNSYLNTKYDFLIGKTNWIVEFGIYYDGTRTASDYGYYLDVASTENYIRSHYYSDDSLSINAISVDTFDRYYGFGPEGGSFNIHSVGYVESDDNVIIGVDNRFTKPDAYKTMERRVEGDTRPTRLNFRGYSSYGFYYCYISWVVVREYFVEDLIVDTSQLLVPNEYVPPQVLDFESYGSDITDIVYRHTSSDNGDPYKLSDNHIESDDSYWEVTGVSTASVSTNFAITTEDLVSEANLLVPYVYREESGMVFLEEGPYSELYDEMNHRYWEGNSEEGWLALGFPSPGYAISIFEFKGETIDNMPKDFLFQRSFVTPYIAREYDWFTLVSGTCTESTDWHMFQFNNYNKYPYYRFVIKSTFGGEVHRVRRWRMFKINKTSKRKVVSKLRLLPSKIGGNENFFPKKISFYGSNDFNDWTPLFEDHYTITPYFDFTYGRWQEVVFDNNKPFWSYKLTMENNWGGSNDRFIIDEWEMYEKKYLDRGYNILKGNSNNINNIWAESDTTIDSGWLYIANEGVNYLFDGKFTLFKELTGSIIDLQKLRGRK